MSTPTEAHVTAALMKAAVVAEAIQSLGSVPNGVLYAQVMSHFSMEEYNGVLGILKRSGLVTESNHVLRWAGGELKRKA